jgi:hypothetical protein
VLWKISRVKKEAMRGSKSETKAKYVNKYVICEICKYDVFNLYKELSHSLL